MGEGKVKEERKRKEKKVACGGENKKQKEKEWQLSGGAVSYMRGVVKIQDTL